MGLLNKNNSDLQLAFPMNTTTPTKEPENDTRNRPAVFLLDGMALVYRSFFALERAAMSTKSGIPTGATYGFLMTLLKIFETYRPEYLAVAFDSKEKTFRHELYAPYKANRPEPPEDLIAQMDMIYKLIEAMRIAVLKQPGYEADDLIGSATKQFERQCDVYIVTPDKDLSQLVHDSVFMLKPGKKQNELLFWDREEIRKHFGVSPEHFIDFLTLTGDSSDNIPGAKGIGPKTASKLLNTYGNLANILDHLHELTPKVRSSLQAFEANRKLVHDLVTIKTDLALDATLSDLEYQTPDSSRLFSLLDKLEMKTVAEKIPHIFPEIQPVQKNDPDRADPSFSPPKGAFYHLVESTSDLEKLAETLAKQKSFALDTETTSLNTFEAELVGISVSWQPGEAYFIHCTGANLDIETTLGALKPVLENPSIQKTGQNLKYDILVLKKYGIALSPVGFDTMLASYVIDPEEKHNLDDLAAKHLDHRTITYSELTGDGKKSLPLREVPIERLTVYACQDADIALKLEEKQKTLLQANKELEKLCTTIEFPLVEVLAEMEYLGISLDTAQLGKTAKTVNRQLAELTERIYTTVGATFNIDSPKQLGNILFDVLGLPAKKTTKTGYSTNLQVLEELALLHPIAKDILEYRSLQKLKNTYIEALPKILNPITGKLHTSFNQHITATGRLSSSNPNLQNIPIRTPLGREIRKAFIPSGSGNYLLSADYSQIELRIAAEISQDHLLLEAFENREDIHTATAKKIFDTDTITQDMRRKAKEVNFGILYGIQPYGLSQRLNIPQKEAKTIITNYTSKYPELFSSLQKTVEQAAEQGYVTTLAGRRRYIKNLRSKNRNIRMAAERAALNTPIQGTAADIIKYAMSLVHETIKKKKMQSSMLLQVHDELVFETTREEKEALASMTKECMEQAARFCGLTTVTIEIETGAGKNWLEAH